MTSHYHFLKVLRERNRARRLFGATSRISKVPLMARLILVALVFGIIALVITSFQRLT